MDAPDELTDRQASLIAQVQAGEISEQQPDTEEQLLALVRLGHLDASHDADGWHFTPNEQTPATDGGEQTPPDGEQTQTPPNADAQSEIDRLMADLAQYGHVARTDDGAGYIFTPDDAPADGTPPNGGQQAA